MRGRDPGPIGRLAPQSARAEGPPEVDGPLPVGGVFEFDPDGGS